jgi:hypothetical protein
MGGRGRGSGCRRQERWVWCVRQGLRCVSSGEEESEAQYEKEEEIAANFHSTALQTALLEIRRERSRGRLEVTDAGMQVCLLLLAHACSVCQRKRACLRACDRGRKACVRARSRHSQQVCRHLACIRPIFDSIVCVCARAHTHTQLSHCLGEPLVYTAHAS